MKLLITLITFTFLFSSCVPETSSKRSAKGANTTTEETPATDDNTDETDINLSSTLSWFTDQYFPTQIELPDEYSSVIYLRGTKAHDYLIIDDNKSQNYCLVLSYTDPKAAFTQLRLSATPISFKNFSLGKDEWLFRIDINKTSSFCSGTIDSVSTYTNSLTALCPNCSALTSLSARIYKASGTTISDSQRIQDFDSYSSKLALKVNVASVNTNPTSGSCSNLSCSQKGFDCCLEGQCVKDKTERPEASVKAASNATFKEYYDQAIADIKNYTIYKDVYYVCSSSVPTDPEEDDPITQIPIDESNEKLVKEYAEYQCLEGAKEDPADYSNCVDSDNDTDSDSDDFVIIRSGIWDRCGCHATTPGEPYCPDYGLKLVKDQKGTITDVICDIPAKETDIPFQDLELTISHKSVPHRFFRDDNGEAVDDFVSLAKSIPPFEQEGTKFYYLDSTNYVGPENGSFNMNSILGSMEYTLTKARPATVVTVEFDQIYIINGQAGYYNPCSDCKGDGWIDALLPFPTAANGLGLTHDFFSTNRSLLGTNSSLANYEDNIFGRACWVPPTMIPFTHMRITSSVQDQRMARLNAQAALYINGYQRDWYGFNKGALIGSFDGVTWFAIGGPKGRKVRATSTKLFLAINAPFGDIAEPSSLTVSVIESLNNNDTVPLVDYDPTKDMTDPYQNSGASCQYFHQCDKDSDCVANLGWEYSCADINAYKTKWPSFDNINAVEKNDAGSDKDFNFRQLLQGTDPIIGSNNKRCVYRGAGSICARDLSALSENQKDLYACAPNFYCADIDTASDFNTELNREVSPISLDQIIFGQGSSILGRAKSYDDASSPLSAAIRASINASADLTTELSGNIGVCRPGKALDGTATLSLETAAQTKDTQSRSDYISQIASCDSSSNDVTYRVQSCPVFEMDEESDNYGNLIREHTTVPATIALVQQAQQVQNYCGAPIKDFATSTSLFEGIEGAALNTSPTLLNPTLSANACLRQAGSFCHTDLDCGPNRLHQSYAESLLWESFSSPAEKKYWEESLICGQAQKKPSNKDEDFFDYSLSKNRCCREVGKDFTMYTAIDNQAIDPDYESDSIGIAVASDTISQPKDNPNFDASSEKRYSRYSSINLESTITSRSTPINASPVVQAGVTPLAFQWKTIASTGKNTCCGGGWIRKFSDGTHDWKDFKRPSFPFRSLQCLNYLNEIYLGDVNIGTLNINAFNMAHDYKNVCISPTNGACTQINFKDYGSTSYEEITSPTDLPAETRVLTMNIDTASACFRSGKYDDVSTDRDSFYFPSATTDTLTTQIDGKYTPVICNPILSAKSSSSFYLPLYIGSLENITNVDIVIYNSNKDSGSTRRLEEGLLPADPRKIDRLTSCPTAALFPDNSYCVESTVNGDIFKYKIESSSGSSDGFDLDTHFIAVPEITYNLPGSTSYQLSAGALPAANIGMTPGNPMYYLSKLGRFDLLGIPQIFYEPIYCNSNKSKLIPNVYGENSAYETRDDFLGITAGFEGGFAYTPSRNSGGGSDIELQNIYDSTASATDSSNTTKTIVLQDKVILGKVFSGKDFACCQELGNVTTTASRCCSGHAVEKTLDGDSEPSLICMLPTNTDLSVYFNRFVSSEGSRSDSPGGGLEDTDFIPETGEPKLSTAVFAKLTALGQAYCEGGAVINGGAFGSFPQQPNNKTFIQESHSDYLSILDSTEDETFLDGDTTGAGHSAFISGRRWNHHLYCTTK